MIGKSIKAIISRFTIIFWLVFVGITRQIVSRFLVNMFWIRLTIWVLNLRGRRSSIWLSFLVLNMVFLLYAGSNASVFRTYFPWRGSPWLLARGSYSHRRNTETKVLVWNESFSFVGAGDVMLKTRNSCFDVLIVWKTISFLQAKFYFLLWISFEVCIAWR